MGVVYEAQQISLNRRVALKMLPFAAMLDRRQLQRFKNEAQAAASLEHPHMVNVFYVGHERGVHFYAMRYVDGISLAELIARVRKEACGTAFDCPRPDHTHTPSSIESSAAIHPEAPHTGCGTAFDCPRPDHTHTPSSIESSAAIQLAGWTNADQLEMGSRPNTTPLPRRFPDQTASVSPPEYGPDSERRASHPIDTSPVAALSTQRTHDRRSYFRAIAQLAIQAAEAIEYAHRMGVIHRDIKPSNLLVDDEAQLWVTDFGLAITQNNPNLTMTGDVLGTLRYTSPEQASGRRGVVDHRTDIYSLGVTWYELLTLRQAFDEHDRQQLLRDIDERDPPLPRSIDSSIPRDLETTVLKAMAKQCGPVRQRARTA